MVQHDLVSIEQLFNVCFLRDPEDSKAYLAISANLQPDYRHILEKKY